MTDPIVPPTDEPLNNMDRNLLSIDFNRDYYASGLLIEINQVGLELRLEYADNCAVITAQSNCKCVWLESSFLYQKRKQETSKEQVGR